MTCYLWDIASVPHCHHSLTTYNSDWEYAWPKLLQKSYELGLLPLVKRFQICAHISKFAPKHLNRFTLRYFSTLTNLQELVIDHLQVSTSMPIVQQCFGHLSPNLLFLALKEPKGTCCQLKDELVKEMVTLLGGLRFCYLDLAEVSCAQLLLYKCAGTLETLRLYSTGASPVEHCPRKYLDLSHQNKSLRTLETTAGLMEFSSLRTLNIPKPTPSSITSPAPLDAVIIFWDCEFSGGGLCMSNQTVYAIRGEDFSQSIKLEFRVLHKMHNVQEF
ncbi:hypothetical protein BJ322DRAFT_1104604 [Thelephora terrestris]|uniref:Uncharacterized protein n=1 Tax=Thelephora terrestris TaxID=56493 RepID=A0A9P6HMZ4_9AGAM|nr:hypothetical protein BJ322DRAFT_1104604 [Thelephora terrestris]